MNRSAFSRLISFCLIIALLLIGMTSCSSAALGKNETVTLSGYLIDVHCFDVKSDPALDSKTCLIMPACAATGYGIAVKQADESYKFYFFDGEYAPNATGAQLLAAGLIYSTTKSDHISVSVTGTLSGKSKKAPGGKSYQIITVSDMAEGDG